MTIQVLLEPAFKMHIPVNNYTSKTCECDVLDMKPSHTLYNFSQYTCQNCSKPIEMTRINDYDQYFGYSGFDEYHELEGDDE